MNDHLRRLLKQLRLSGLIDSLEVRLQEATGHGLTHAEFLELILGDELAVRQQRAIGRRIKQAGFRELKTLEDFDFSFNTSIPRRRIYDLATGHFLREAADVLMLGAPGLGKSHLCQAIGYAVIKANFTVLYRSIFDVVRDFLHDAAFDGGDKTLQRYLKPDLLIIDDMGMKKLPNRSGECLFEIILRRHEVKSTIMTSNRPLEDWGKLIGDVPAASAILDRFLERSELIQITGRSYRLRNGSEEASGEEKETSPRTSSPKPAKKSKTDKSDPRVEDETPSEKTPSSKRTQPDETDK